MMYRKKGGDRELLFWRAKRGAWEWVCPLRAVSAVAVDDETVSQCVTVAILNGQTQDVPMGQQW